MTYAVESGLLGREKQSFGMSPVLAGLLSVMNEEGVSYCCWKSDRRVGLALAGHSDLDLLVARDDREHLLRLLTERCFKHWSDVPGRDHPAVMSFLGYDETSGIIHHLHVHFRLVVGSAMLKNYRVPCEQAFLARSIPHSVFPIRVLDPEDAALLLLIRAHVEFHWLDPIAWRQRKSIRRKFAEDFDNLAPRVSRDVLLARAMEVFTPDTARAIVDSFPTLGNSWTRHGIRLAIARELVSFRLYGAIEATIRSAGRLAGFLAAEINRRLLCAPRPSRRRAPGGGIVIAFVGVDGSGKSTQVSTVQAWLEGEIDVLTYYFGTGDGRPSLILLPFKSIAPLVTRFIKTKPKGASHGKISDRPPGPGYAFLFAVWSSVVALEKRHKIISARRAASRGLVVLTDRYPQNEIIGFNDGPLLPRLTHAPQWLRRFETSVYALAHRTPPDLVIKLQTSAEVVAKREPEMSELLIRQRIAWLEDLKFPGAQIVCLDARRPLDEVSRSTKHEIWKAL